MRKTRENLKLDGEVNYVSGFDSLRKAKETCIMNNLKTNRVITLKQVGVNRKEVEGYRKSSREYLVQYRGREGKLIT